MEDHSLTRLILMVASAALTDEWSMFITMISMVSFLSIRMASSKVVADLTSTPIFLYPARSSSVIRVFSSSDSITICGMVHLFNDSQDLGAQQCPQGLMTPRQEVGEV